MIFLSSEADSHFGYLYLLAIKDDRMHLNASHILKKRNASSYCQAAASLSDERISDFKMCKIRI